MSIIQAMPPIELKRTETQLSEIFPVSPVNALGHLNSIDVAVNYYASYLAISEFVEATADITIQPEPALSNVWIEELKGRTTWADRESREYYAEAAVEQGLAYQIRINRELRGLTQRELAATIGTRQSAISRMEDPDYGSHSIPKLLQVAHAFDCALLIKLVPFSTLAREAKCLTEQHLYAKGYDEEVSGDQ